MTRVHARTLFGTTSLVAFALLWGMALVFGTVGAGADRVPVTRFPDPNEAPEKEMVRLGQLTTEPGQLKGRAPIYDPKADGRSEIRAALVRAHFLHKRVLLQFGANSCAYCYRMYDGLQKHATVAPLFSREYELVMLDASSNFDLLSAYDPGLSDISLPWLVIVDSDGKALVSQNPEELGRSTNFDPKKIQAFFERWKREPVDAEEVLASALKTAGEAQKRVLVNGGPPASPWGKLLDRFLIDHQELLDADYVAVRIDPGRMQNAAPVQKRVRSAKAASGSNWLVVLDASGDPVESTDANWAKSPPSRQSKEVDAFVGLLKKTRQHLTDEQLATLERDFREAIATPAPMKKSGNR